MFISEKSFFDDLFEGIKSFNEYYRTIVTIRTLERLREIEECRFLIPEGTSISVTNKENDTKRNEDLCITTPYNSLYGFSQRVIREKYKGYWPKGSIRFQSQFMKNQTEIDKDYNPGSRAESRVCIITNYEFTSIIGISIYSYDFFRRFLRQFNLDKLKEYGHPIVFNNPDNTKSGWYTDLSILNLFGREEFLKNSIIYHNTAYKNNSKDHQIQRLKDAWERCRL